MQRQSQLPKEDFTQSVRRHLEIIREVLDVPSQSLPLPYDTTPNSIEQAFFAHPYAANGAMYDQPHMKTFQSQLHATAPVKRLAELQRRKQQVLLALQRCNRMTDRYLKSRRDATWAVKQLHRITTDLSMDLVVGQTLALGTKSANTGFCFMAELSLGLTPSAPLVENSAITFLIGNPDDLPAPTVAASEEFKELLMGGQLELLNVKLTRIRAFENLLLRHPEKNLYLSLGEVENAFNALSQSIPQTSVQRLLDGPSLTYLHLPLENCKPYRLTFLGPQEVIEPTGGIRFPYQFDLQPPVCMEAMSLARLGAMLGTASAIPHESQGASFHRLLAVSDDEGALQMPEQLPSHQQPATVSMPDGFKQAWTTHGDAMQLRGAVVSSLTMPSLEALPQMILALRQQMLFNHLYRSVFGTTSSPSSFTSSSLSSSSLSSASSSSLSSSSSSSSAAEITGEFELHAEPPSLLRVVHPGFVLVIDVAEIAVRVEAVAGESRVCSNKYATQLLRTCLNIPLTVRYICQKLKS